MKIGFLGKATPFLDPWVAAFLALGFAVLVVLGWCAEANLTKLQHEADAKIAMDR